MQIGMTDKQVERWNADTQTMNKVIPDHTTLSDYVSLVIKNHLTIDNLKCYVSIYNVHMYQVTSGKSTHRFFNLL